MKPKLYLEIHGLIDQENQDVAAIRDQIARWQELFSPAEITYSLNGYEGLYFTAPDALLVYDNFAETDTMWRGFDRYRTVWEEQINSNFPGFIMFRIEVDEIEVSGALAWSAFTWWGSVVKDGQKIIPAQHATHIWHKIDRQWVIVHEHLTSGVKEKGQLSTRPEEAVQTSNTILH
jgi:ketosteroid isomerase-like protein